MFKHVKEASIWKNLVSCAIGGGGVIKLERQFSNDVGLHVPTVPEPTFGVRFH